MLGRPFAFALITENVFNYAWWTVFYWHFRDRAFWPQGESWIRIFFSTPQNAK